VIKDISERKKAEAEIAHTNRALATVSAVNRKLVYATDENETASSNLPCDCRTARLSDGIGWLRATG